MISIDRYPNLNFYFPDNMPNKENKEKYNELKTRSEEYWNSLFDEYKKALKSYAGELTYRKINSFLRKTQYYTPDGFEDLTEADIRMVEKTVLRIDKVLMFAPRFSFPIGMFRTVRLEENTLLNINNILTDTAYKSFSANFVESFKFCRSRECVVLHAIIPPNTPVFYYNGASEEEIILPRQTILIKKNTYSIGNGNDKLFIMNIGLQSITSSLIEAAESQDLEKMKYIISKGEKPDFNLLLFSIKKQNLDMMKLVLQSGVDIRQENNQALVDAVMTENMSIVQYIVEADTPNIEAYTRALGVAIDIKNLKITEYLMGLGAKRALRKALLTRDGDMVNNVVKFGAKVEGIGEMRSAVNTSNLAIVKLVAQMGADVQEDDNEALETAIITKNVDVLKFLIDSGANVQARNNQFLIDAVKIPLLDDENTRGSIDMVKLLVEAGANVQANNNKAIKIAIKNKNNVIVKYLLEHGAKP